MILNIALIFISHQQDKLNEFFDLQFMLLDIV